MEAIYIETLNAVKKYNAARKMWQYVTQNGEIILGCKTEKGLDSSYVKYLRSIQQ